MSRKLSTRRGSCGWVVLLLFLPSLAGCGAKKTAVVSGAVTYKGQPLTVGAVTFHGADGRIESANIDPQGNYTMSQAPVGPVTVTVAVSQPRLAPVARDNRPGGKPVKHPGEEQAGPALKPVNIPGKYKDPSSSGLTFTVNQGNQTINLPLE